jgi:biopolymer transport protein ExbB
MTPLMRTFLGIFDEGGWILWPIFSVSIVAWYVGILKFVHMHRLGRARTRLARAWQSGTRQVRTGNPAYDELAARVGSTTGPAVNAAREFMAAVVPDLDRGFSTISTCASAAPLMGLLGTIAGMNRMFSVINEFGYGSPLLMAGAISTALQASLTGLMVAVAAMFLHNHLYNRRTACLAVLTRDFEALVERGSLAG